MLDKIKEWMFFKYGIQVPKKIILLFLTLLGSIVLLILSLLLSGGSGGGSGNAIDPNCLLCQKCRGAHLGGWLHR